MTLEVSHVPVLGDNLVWLIPTGPAAFAAVDPGEGAPVAAFLDARKARLSHLLLTHHHGDHVGGVAALVARYKPQVIGSRADRNRLPPLDLAVGEGDRFSLGERAVRVFFVPGHTNGHVAYLVGDALFSGDTLFHYGCGRLFEGSPETMWGSLCRLRALPDATRLFPAHEYTRQNLAFVQHLEPQHPLLPEAIALADDRLAREGLTPPNALGREKALNPFLRADDPSLAAACGLPADTPPVEVFRTVRLMKDRF